MQQEEREESARDKQLAQELEWIKKSPKARQSKSKARITAYEELLAQQGKGQVGNAQIVIPAGPRLGDDVIKAEGVSKAFW